MLSSRQLIIHSTFTNMKKIVITLALCLSMGNVFAQTDADKLREAADAAMTAKNYAEAYKNYDAFLKQTNNEDADRVFNCAIAAFQAKMYNEAVTYFDLAIAKGKNVDDSYIRKAMSLNSLDKTEELVKTIEAGLKSKPGDANLEKVLYNHCMKKAQALQKAGKVAEAETMYKHVLMAGSKAYKGNTLYSLGAMFYNEGAKILADAAKKPETYEAEKAKADAEMNKAKSYLQEALTLNPNDTKPKSILESIDKTLAQ